LKGAHRVARFENVTAVEAERGQFQLSIKLLVLKVEDVNGAFIATRAQVPSITAEVYPDFLNKNYRKLYTGRFNSIF
jgi:hypothetical protein